MAASPLLVNNFIDSCAFDPKYEPETSASNEIFMLSEEQHFTLLIAHSTQKEIDHPNTPAWVKTQAAQLVYSIDMRLTSNENQLLRDVEMTIAGNGKIENIAQDAQHVFEAQKCGGYFVTTDKRILSRAADLEKLCGLSILLPGEFLVLVRQHIAGEQK
ncbi:MAG TPA: hypothetical protein PLC86_18385 [Candidatus Accumulibacter phosphatis]|nr:hypothetical protein [Candidatus Accumulibacter phosphatis]